MTHLVPGCKEKWKAHNNFCFSVLTNDTLTTSEMKDVCIENKGELVYAMNKRSFHLAERFLYTMQLNAETNSSHRVVLGPANASSFATLPVSHSSVYSVATHTCAYSDSSQLKVEPCDANNYGYLCMTLRGNQCCVRKLLCFFNFPKTLFHFKRKGDGCTYGRFQGSSGQNKSVVYNFKEACLAGFFRAIGEISWTLARGKKSRGGRHFAHSPCSA